MKNIRKFFICAALCVAGMLTSCGSLSNMSQEDAWNVGVGAGTFLRNVIDN